MNKEERKDYIEKLGIKVDEQIFPERLGFNEYKLFELKDRSTMFDTTIDIISSVIYKRETISGVIRLFNKITPYFRLFKVLFVDEVLSTGDMIYANKIEGIDDFISQKEFCKEYWTDEKINKLNRLCVKYTEVGCRYLTDINQILYVERDFTLEAFLISVMPSSWDRSKATKEKLRNMGTISYLRNRKKINQKYGTNLDFKIV